MTKQGDGIRLGTVKLWNAAERYAIVSPDNGGSDLIVSSADLVTGADEDPVPGSEISFAGGRLVNTTGPAANETKPGGSAAQKLRIYALEQQLEKHESLLARFHGQMAYLQSQLRPAASIDSDQASTGTAVPEAGDPAESVSGQLSVTPHHLDRIGDAPMPNDRGAFAHGVLQEFGGYIRKHRKACGITLEELAGRAGTSVPQLSQIERGSGKRGPSLDLVARILWALDLRFEFGEVKNRSAPLGSDL